VFQYGQGAGSAVVVTDIEFEEVHGDNTTMRSLCVRSAFACPMGVMSIVANGKKPYNTAFMAHPFRALCQGGFEAAYLARPPILDLFSAFSRPTCRVFRRQNAQGVVFGAVDFAVCLGGAEAKTGLHRITNRIPATIGFEVQHGV
jgi:hypothetical protein